LLNNLIYRAKEINSMAYRIVLRQDTSANWTQNNPTLLSGEFGFETNTYNLKLGDGVAPWQDLPYWNSIAAGPSGAPATGGSPGSAGQMAYDYSGSTGFLYVCVGTNTWLRTTLTSF
jgi:hypothetical protein